MRKKQQRELAARPHILPLTFYLQEKRVKLFAIINPHL